MNANGCPMHGVEAASHFLRYWFLGCEGLAELRYKTADRMVQEWFDLGCLENMARRAVTLSSEGSEVYFGVCTRLERRGRRDSVAQVPGLFCDLDFGAFAAGAIEALERLDSFTPQPTALVHSGGGLHSYWRLKIPLLPAVQTSAMIRALVRELRGDHAATDLSRVLRVPGTWSFKRDAPVRLLRCLCSTSRNSQP